jgi:hypothetical protein
MANVLIDIAAEFVGNKAFKQADTATDKLTKNVKKLAGAFGLAFSATAVLAYGKAAVKAAAEDEKAQKQLALALKNVGLGRDAASSEDYIQRLQTEFGILDDDLRPAYQTLAVATRDTNEAQRLLNLSLDISAATGKDLGSVTGALSRAYLGNNAALSRLGVGISKADLKAGKFEDIIGQLEGTFKGAATQAVNTFQGSIDKLSVAAANASEIIGTGLIDALKGLGEQDSVDNLATAMQDTAIYIADVIRGIGVLTEKLKGLPGVSGLNVGMIPIIGSYIDILRGMGQVAAGSGINAQGLADLARLQSQFTVRTLAANKKITAEERKQLSAKRLKLALDKASLALSKGEEIFDMDKIQNEAALKSQAEALGKATTSQQVLQIANDTARLNVKKSILALEDAMASKDEASIVAATNKLNADLKVLGTLGQQNIKLLDIKSVLESLKPLDLINTTNLEEALALLGKINLAQTGSTRPDSRSTALTAVAAIAPAIAAARGTSVASVEAANQAKVLSLSERDLETFNKVIASGLNTSLRELQEASSPMMSYAATEQYGNQYNITVQAGIGDPNAIAEAIDQVLTDAAQRGTLRGYTIG